MHLDALYITLKRGGTTQGTVAVGGLIEARWGWHARASGNHLTALDIDTSYDMFDHNCVEFQRNVLARVRAQDKLTIIFTIEATETYA